MRLPVTELVRLPVMVLWFASNGVVFASNGVVRLPVTAWCVRLQVLSDAVPAEDWIWDVHWLRQVVYFVWLVQRFLVPASDLQLV